MSIADACEGRDWSKTPWKLELQALPPLQTDGSVGFSVRIDGWLPRPLGAESGGVLLLLQACPARLRRRYVQRFLVVPVGTVVPPDSELNEKDRGRRWLVGVTQLVSSVSTLLGDRRFATLVAVFAVGERAEEPLPVDKEVQ